MIGALESGALARGDADHEILESDARGGSVLDDGEPGHIAGGHAKNRLSQLHPCLRQVEMRRQIWVEPGLGPGPEDSHFDLGGLRVGEVGVGPHVDESSLGLSWENAQSDEWRIAHAQGWLGSSQA